MIYMFLRGQIVAWLLRAKNGANPKLNYVKLAILIMILIVAPSTLVDGFDVNLSQDYMIIMNIIGWPLVKSIQIFSYHVLHNH